MDIKTIFSQNVAPVVYRPCQGKLQVKIPSSRNSYNGICNLLPKSKQRSWRKPPPPRGLQWSPSLMVWFVSRSHFEHIVKQSIQKFGVLILLQCYREKQVCAPACWNAHGLECDCSCLGANHGTGQPGGRWYIMGDAFAVHWGDVRVSCQYLIKSQLGDVMHE